MQIKISSIRQRIAILGGISLLIVALGIIGYAVISMNSISSEGVKKDLYGMGENESIPIKSDLEEALSVSHTLAQTFSGLRENGFTITPTEADAIIRQTLSGHPEYTGMYVLWEPGAFDGRGIESAKKDGFDLDGRYQTWWIRQNSTITRGPYNPDQSFITGEYYYYPQKTLQSIVTEPYVDADTNQLMTSAASPIIVNGKFAGIAGVDITLDTLSKQADLVSGYANTQKMYIISSGGIITGATGDHTLLGTNLKNVTSLSGTLTGDEILSAYNSGDQNYLIKNGTIVTRTNFTLGSIKEPWYILLTVPEEKAMETVRSATFMMVLIGVILTILGIFFLSYAAKKISDPIKQITVFSEQISQGDMTVPLSLRSDDEIGTLADSFRHLKDELNAKAEAARAIARGDMSITIPVTSPKDTLGSAMKTMHANISRMTDDVQKLSHAAISGDLQVRADPSPFEGEFKEIIRGINATLDAVIHPIREAMILAEKYASCDYTAVFNPDISVKGNFASFRDSLNSVGKRSGSAVITVKKQINAVTHELEETMASIEEVAAGSARLAESASSVSIYAESGLKEISNIQESMDELVARNTDVTSMTGTVASISKYADTLSTKGVGLARKAEEGMQQITDSIQESSTTMESMSAQMEEIGGIVNLINEIAEQTNLLALNAAIEAARAGDAGLGFTVVAQEVKALAVESQLATERIVAMITNLQTQSQKTTGAMERSSGQVTLGNAAVAETLNVFSEIVKQIGEISKNASAVSDASIKQVTAVDEITARVHELESHLRKTTTEAMASAAATEQTSAALDQISHSITKVVESSDNINQEMERFKVHT